MYLRKLKKEMVVTEKRQLNEHKMNDNLSQSM